MEANKPDDDIGADERHFKREVAKPLGAISIVIIMLSVDELNPVKILCSYFESVKQSTVATAAFILLTLLVIDQAENLIYWGARLFFRSTLNNIFFKSVEIVGAENIPRKGPIILTGNHNNQFVDGIMLLTNCRRDICFMIAEKSWNRPFVGFWARVFKCIPVSRAQDMAKRGSGIVSVSGSTVTGSDTKFLSEIQSGAQVQFAKDEKLFKVKEVVSDTELVIQLDTSSDAPPAPVWESVPYKVLPKVDQSAMYNAVHQGLGEGQCLGIFPEGGSHDRTDLLPLKAGVAIIALDAFRLHKMRVPIIPVGLNYYRGHRFRGRVVIEFGTPEYIPDALYSQYEGDRRGAVDELLHSITTAMRSVIVPAPDYRSLQLIYMVRRLYVHEGRKLTAEQTMDLNRRFAAAYRRILKETEPMSEETQTAAGGQEALAVKSKGEDDLQNVTLSTEDVTHMVELKAELEDYMSALKRLGIRDHQVSQIQWRTMADVVGRLLYLVVCATLGAIPQLMFNLPVMMLAQALASQEQKKALASSSVKLAARDVVMSYTIIYCLCFVPVLYFTYAVLLFLFSGWRLLTIGLFLSLCPLFSLFGVKASEQGVHAYADILPMFLRLRSACRKEQDALPARRFELRAKVRKAVKQIGPQFGGLYYQKDVNWRKGGKELNPQDKGSPGASPSGGRDLSPVPTGSGGSHTEDGVRNRQGAKVSEFA
mmetsp:Transcript_19569/g.45496  ORF Transcript_19569/g.45496 Transcript_19569/m.45496 type:complete len:707 (+) Transcript_19569:132-2252(+)